MTVGSIGLAELSPTLRKVEQRLGREINVTSYSAREFRAKVAVKDHFLSQVLRSPREFVSGDQGALDALTDNRRSVR